MAYARFAPMISAASARPALWRAIAGGISAILLLVAWLCAVAVFFSLTEGVGFGRALAAVTHGDPATPEGALKYLLIVGGLGFTTLLAARFWHQRPAVSLTGPAARTLRHFVIALGITFAAAALLMLIPGPQDATIERNMELSVWLWWLPFALFAIAAQTGAEEVFFRGYLQSQFAARFASPLIWLTIPAFAFGLAHYSPALPAQTAWAYVGFATLFGLLAGDLTARTGSIGAAWGLHFANNTIAVTIIAVDGTMTGLGLFRSTAGLERLIDLSPWILADLGALILVWLLLRRVLD
ncbi:MAG: CPBP family intramembrane metalloprotease [Boseongicola sp.]|nr:CPBP family intramembrane metalloprotease [Boseongicola sp.]NNJ66817.1 CPBP family intramembrane metalloprotease [Boseongicola sp.]